MGEYKDGSIGFFLMILVMDMGLLIAHVRGWMKYDFLRVFNDKIILPEKQGLFLRREVCYLKNIKKVYPNINTMRNYVVLLTTEDDPVWKGEPIQIWKKDIYSTEDFINTLDKLGLKIERDVDYEVMYTPGLSTALRGREVRK